MNTIWSVGCVFILSVSFFGLYTLAADCDCPHEFCANMPTQNRRCKCCIIEFLGKRSSPQNPDPLKSLKRSWEHYQNQPYKQSLWSKRSSGTEIQSLRGYHKNPSDAHLYIYNNLKPEDSNIPISFLRRQLQDRDHVMLRLSVDENEKDEMY